MFKSETLDLFGSPISSLEPDYGKSRAASPAGPTIVNSGPPHIPVSRFRSLDSDKAMSTQDTSGPLFTALSPSAALGEGLEGQRGNGDDCCQPGWIGSGQGGSVATADDSFWSDAVWLRCADGKARRAKPGLRLLVDGMAGRTDLWRLAGNSIVPQLAATVLGAVMEAIA